MPKPRASRQHQERKSHIRTAKVVVVALLFIVTAYVGIRGQRHARRQAQFDVVLFCRDRLQEALDAQRSTRGLTSEFSSIEQRSLSPEVDQWAAELRRRITKFRSTQVPASKVEALDLRLSEATLAVAEYRFSDALRAIETDVVDLEPDESGMPGRGIEVLRVQADTAYDQRDWTAALEHYRRILVYQPHQLNVVERVAECLYLLRQRAQAHDTYADLARHLSDRGNQLMTQLDYRSAGRDLHKAARIRDWLFRQGRNEIEADLTRSLSTYGDALVQLQRFDRAKASFAAAISMQERLIRTLSITTVKHRDLVGELAGNHAKYAGVLFELGNPQEALAHFDSSINLLNRLAGERASEASEALAKNLAHRGFIRLAQGERPAAAQDFEKAAETSAGLGKFADAVEWQKKAIDLAGDDKKSEAQSRLDHYRSGEPYPGATNN